MTAVVHRPGEGERVGGPSKVTIKAMGADTAGSFYLGKVSAEPGFAGPPLHVHERLHDTFYVPEGTLTVPLGDETTELAEGSFVCVPPGAAHTFSNPGADRVRFLNFSTPGGWENYMRALGAALAQGTPSAQEMGAIAPRYDFRAV